MTDARVDDRGPLKVYYTMAGKKARHELWPGYHVQIIKTGADDHWALISYLFNNKNYHGWVLREGLELVEPIPTIEDEPFSPMPLPQDPNNGLCYFPWIGAAAVFTVTVIIVFIWALFGMRGTLFSALCRSLL